MELKTKNNVWLYLYRYNSANPEALPQSICPLFWEGLLGLFFIVFTPLPTIICTLYCAVKGKSIIQYFYEQGITPWKLFITEKIFIILYFILTFFTADVIFGYKPGGDLPLWLWFFGFLIIPSAFLIIMGLVGLITTEGDKVKEIIKVPVSAIVSKTKKICPTITWK